MTENHTTDVVHIIGSTVAVLAAVMVGLIIIANYIG
jgi:hypothetical protein